MSIEKSPTADASDASQEVGYLLRSRLDRHCRHCDEVALVYDTDADAARCRACGELDRISEQL